MEGQHKCEYYKAIVNAQMSNNIDEILQTQQFLIWICSNKIIPII